MKVEIMLEDGEVFYKECDEVQHEGVVVRLYNVIEHDDSPVAQLQEKQMFAAYWNVAGFEIVDP